MDLSPHTLAFLEHEMKQIKGDPTRDSEEQAHASTVLRRIEWEMEQDQETNDDFEVSELLS